MKPTPAFLRSLGLSESQGAVYLATLELGEASILEIARKSGVKRSSIYNFIDELKERHLLLEVKKRKRRVFSAISPAQLLEMQKTRLVELTNLMPSLFAIHNQAQHKPRVTFYEGIDGLKEVYADTLHENKPIVSWSDFEHMYAVLGKEYCDSYPKERTRRGIPSRAIARQSKATEHVRRFEKNVLLETKCISIGDLSTEINVYGDKVAMMSLRNKPVFAVLIQDPSIAETLRTAWNELWKRL